MTDERKVWKLLKGLGPSYDFVRELGRGSTAVVYLVRDTELERDVAVKVIRSSFLDDEEAVVRLRREARLVAGLQHPNVVKLFGTTTLADGSFAVLMEHVPGRNLREIIRDEGAMPPERVVAVLRDIASALAYAHRRRIVHRDVKPENIYFDEEVDAARLADFGVARPWDRDNRLTMPGMSLGTPAYMSPEQIDDDSVDGRADIYSLGVVGYELLAGGHPWDGDNLFSIIFKQKNEELPPVDGPSELLEVLRRAYRKDPDDRWPSAASFLDALDGLTFGRSRPRAGDPATAPHSGSGGTTETAATSAADHGVGSGTGSVGGAGPAGVGGVPTTGDLRTGEAPIRPEGAGSAAVERAAGGRDARKHAPPDRLPARPRGEPVLPPRKRSRSRAKVVSSAVLAAVVAGLGFWWAGGGGWPSWLSGSRPSGASGSGPVGSALAGEPDRAEPPDPASGAAPGQSGQTGVRDGDLQGTSDPGGGAASDASSLRMTVTTAAGGRLDPGSVSEPLVVQLVDSAGRPRAGAPVRFVVTQGRAEVEPAVVTTDTSGFASATLTAPDEPGPVAVIAALEGSTTPGARWEFAVGPARARIASVEGATQETVVGSLVERPIGVRVTDAEGRPVAGAEVTFSVEAGGGSMTPVTGRSDAAGWALARWRLGSAVGEQRARIGVPSADTSVLVRATALAETPAEEAPGEEDPSAAPDEGALSPLVIRRHGVSVGGASVCAVASSGRVRCRGANDRGQAGVASAPAMASVVAGVGHVCGLNDAGTAFCWGGNDTGQLGDGTTTDRAEARPVATETRFRDIAAGLGHSCALDGDGRVHCWGRNLAGQLGDGSRDDRAVPRPAGRSASLRSITAGWNHTCGLTAAGRAYCWGLNSDGQLGDGTRLDRLAPGPVPEAPAFTALAAGSAHSCGLTAGGRVHCWGANAAGQLGDGSTTGRPLPGAVTLPGDAVDLVAGAVHTCALLADGRAFCWGQNVHGQLGDGTTSSRARPVLVRGGHAFRTLFAGGGTTCGITRQGEEYCWGLNQNGQLGDGTRSNRTEPVRVGG